MARTIELCITDFKDFRKNGFLYVDKTHFIEHVLNSNRIQLFCRPRRVGKTMNLTMLKYFFDLKEESQELFEGLFIEQSEGYHERNKYPVIYLNFKDLRKEDYIPTFISLIKQELSCYLQPEQFSDEVEQALTPPYSTVRTLLKSACKNLYDIYNIQPIILIDEYDKPVMDTANTDEFEAVRDFVKAVLSSALKDNQYLNRAVMTGVNRIAQESMFSD